MRVRNNIRANNGEFFATIGRRPWSLAKCIDALFIAASGKSSFSKDMKKTNRSV